MKPRLAQLLAGIVLSALAALSLSQAILAIYISHSFKVTFFLYLEGKSNLLVLVRFVASFDSVLCVIAWE